MNTIKKLLGEGRYNSPELVVIDIQVEGAVLSSSWPTTGDGGLQDLRPGDDL